MRIKIFKTSIRFSPLTKTRNNNRFRYIVLTKPATRTKDHSSNTIHIYLERRVPIVALFAFNIVLTVSLIFHGAYNRVGFKAAR